MTGFSVPMVIAFMGVGDVMVIMTAWVVTILTRMTVLRPLNFLKQPAIPTNFGETY